MSGEAVVTTAPIAAIAVSGPVLLAGGLIAGTAVAGGLAVRGVAAVIEARAREAQRRADEERARLAEWQAFDRRQRRAMDEARERHAAIARAQQRLHAVPLVAPSTTSQPAASSGPRAVGYTSSQPQERARRAAALAALAGIADALNNLPEAVQAHPASPVATLRQQVDNQRGRLEDNPQNAPVPSHIDALTQTAERSIAAFMGRVESERDELARRVERAEAALRMLLVLEQLPGPEAQGLRRVRAELMQALEHNHVSAAELDRLEQSLKGLAQQAAERMATTAIRPALASALLRHLREMGYQVLGEFPDIDTERLTDETLEARVRIPGGEQVAIGLDADANLRFNMMHERQGNRGNSLTREELQHLRVQEQRWCRDLQTLVARLVQDGFDSRIRFEQRCRSVQCMPVPGVVVERFTADEYGIDADAEIDSDAYDDEEQHRKYFTDGH